MSEDCSGICQGHSVGDGKTSGGTVHHMTDPYRPAASRADSDDSGETVKRCPGCRSVMEPGRAWWWTEHGATCSEGCARELIARVAALASPAARPAEPPGELLDDEWWLRLFHVTSEARDFVPYDAASEYPVPHVAAFRAAAEPLLAPLLEKLRRVEALVDRVAANPENTTDRVWIRDLRHALDGS